MCGGHLVWPLDVGMMWLSYRRSGPHLPITSDPLADSTIEMVPLGTQMQFPGTVWCCMGQICAGFPTLLCGQRFRPDAAPVFSQLLCHHADLCH